MPTVRAAPIYLTKDVVVGVLVQASSALPDGSCIGTADMLGVSAATLYDALSKMQWPEQLGGFYYVKPNYPDRSSHNCNAGFIVPTPIRGMHLGSLLAQSFVQFAPRFGYRASVFNLVYRTNLASAKIWERLGFETVGRIPRAGLLRQSDGTEAYVDAHIIYKEFVSEAEGAHSAC